MKTLQKPIFIFLTLIVWFLALIPLGCGGGTSRIDIDTRASFLDAGVVRPMAHRQIFLLNNSITSPEMEEAFKRFLASKAPPRDLGYTLTEGEIRTRAGFMLSDGKAIWRKYIVQKLESDWDGKVAFRRLQAGDYWIYCIIQTARHRWLLWNVKAPVKFYENINVSLTDENIAFEERAGYVPPSR